MAADASMAEMVARAQQQAIARAWLRMAEQVTEFLDSLPEDKGTSVSSKE